MRSTPLIPTLVVALALGCGGRGTDDGGKHQSKQAEAPPPDFSKDPPPDELDKLIARGEQAYEDHGCDSCHAVSGNSGARGPSFVGLYGTRARFADQSEAVRDEAYLYESIVDPAARLIEGWAQSPMPITPMETDEIVALVYYIRSLANDAETDTDTDPS
ncbi:MAG TPA: cytochrome c [Enhygromyxa sp.]|nr:cytochrome c [Enhygromyxa sp.]